MIKSIKKKKKVLIFLLLVTISSTGALKSSVFVAGQLSEDNNINRNYVTMDMSDLIIPTKKNITSDGYPTNKKGQTYGPDMGNIMSEEPDLLLTKGADGVLGYIFPPEGIDSPGELDEYNKADRKWTPLYLQDGETVIGKFYFN